jgi:hypothetical protein
MIKRDGTIGRDGPRIVNQHVVIDEYRRRTGADHGTAHFLGSLENAEKNNRLVYQPGRSHTPAGYAPIMGCQC